jgi:PAS domain S-box-containing protein
VSATIIKSRVDIKRLSIAWVVIITASTFLILLNACTLKLTSAVRSYVNGESLYAKGQKDATRYLLMYINTSNEKYWTNFSTSLQIPIGDSLARAGMMGNTSDYLVRKAFLQGGNHVGDVDEMIWLFRNFKTVPFMSEAIQVWKLADKNVGELAVLGSGIRSHLKHHSTTPQQLKQTTERIEKLSAELDMREQQFSKILGGAARKINIYLLYTNVIATILIVATAVWISSGMIKRLYTANETLRRTLDFGGMSSGTIDFKKMELTLSAELLHILDMNRLSPRTMSLQRFLDVFVSPECHQMFYEELEACNVDENLSTEIELEFQVQTIKKKDKVLRLKALVSDGNAFAIIQDITSVKKLEVDSVARARYIEKIIYSITDGFFAVGKDWRITLANPEFARLLKREADQLVGKTVWEVFPEYINEMVKGKYQEVVTKGEAQHFEVFASDMTFDVHAYPHEEGLLVCFRDVSEKKRAAMEIAEREQHLHQVLNGLPVAVYLTDDTGSITSYNEAAVSLWKRTPATHEKWCGSFRLFNDEGFPLSHRDSPMAVAVQKQVPMHNIEAIIERPDGERLNVMAYATPFHRKSGDFAGAMNVMIDITSRRKMEVELKEREKEEERKRIANLIEGQELERARLSREMHDGLGQLLNAIQYNLDTIEESNVGQVKGKVVKLISETLIESKRISANLLPLKLIDFDLITCVSSLCEQVNSEKVKVVFQTKPFKDDYTGHQRLTLYRIIQEGLQNAVKHSGCRQIFVQLYREETGLHISIEDDGRGFDKSSKLDAGHGLRNIRHRAEVLNGKLEIESSPQYGTLLSISVPLNIAV